MRLESQRITYERAGKIKSINKTDKPRWLQLKTYRHSKPETESCKRIQNNKSTKSLGVLYINLSGQGSDSIQKLFTNTVLP